jgi:hypothetical protein
MLFLVFSLASYSLRSAAWTLPGLKLSVVRARQVTMPTMKRRHESDYDGEYQDLEH